MSVALDALVVCPGFRWLRGMSNTRGGVVYEGQEESGDLMRWVGRRGVTDYVTPDDDRPDLDDPATCGCLLALVCAAWGQDFSVSFNPEGTVEVMHVSTANAFYFHGETGGLALVAALLAAPTKGDGR